MIKNNSSFFSLSNSLNVKHEKQWALLCAALLFFSLQQRTNVIVFPYDSANYWDLANPSVFFNFPATIRGYFYPFLLLPARFIANTAGQYSVYPFRIYSALANAFALTVVLPSFYIAVFGGRINFVRRLVVPILVVIIYPGLINYPLTDLPSFLLLVGALSLLFNLKVSDEWNLRTILHLILGGVLIYGAYNTRTIYLFPLLFILLAVPLILFKRHLFKTKIIATAILIAGMGLASIPQMIINLNRANSFSPFVISEISDKSLFALQAMWGIPIQKYSTNIGPGSSPGQYFMDDAGVRLFEFEKLSRDDVSIKTVFTLLTKHPLHFVGAYARHVINGLDIRDGEEYIRDVNKSTNLLAIFNFGLIFLSSWTLYLRKTRTDSKIDPSTVAKNNDFASIRKKATKDWAIWLAILIIPVIAITPGAIETRFYLPLHFLIYCTVAFNCSVKEVKDHLYSNALLILSVFLVTFSFYFALSLNTQATQQGGVNLKYKYVRQ